MHEVGFHARQGFQDTPAQLHHRLIGALLFTQIVVKFFHGEGQGADILGAYHAATALEGMKIPAAILDGRWLLKIPCEACHLRLQVFQDLVEFLGEDLLDVVIVVI